MDEALVILILGISSSQHSQEFDVLSEGVKGRQHLVVEVRN